MIKRFGGKVSPLIGAAGAGAFADGGGGTWALLLFYLRLWPSQ